MTRTFTQYLLEVTDRDDKHPYVHVLSCVGISLKLMSAIVSRGCLVQRPGGDDSCSDATETNRIIQEAAIDAILGQAASCEQLAAISFSGDPEIHQFSDDGLCLLAMDVLHQATTLMENQPIGVAFSIMGRTAQGPVAVEEFLRPASDILCSGVALFGPASVLIVTTGAGVDAFTLDRDVGNYVLTTTDITLPTRSDVLAIDLSHAAMWPAPIRRYVDERIRESQEPDGRPAIMRWNNSAVLGCFRALFNGGLFMLPRTNDPRMSGVPLIHTAAPITMLIEQAGGAATDGQVPLSSVTPTELDQYSPIIFGAAADIASIEQYAEDPDASEVRYPLFQNRTLFVRDQ